MPPSPAQGHLRQSPTGFAETHLSIILLSPPAFFLKKGHSHPNFTTEDSFAPPSIWYTSGCVMSQGLSLGLGPAMGHLPWGGGEPNPLAPAHAKTSLPGTPLQRGSTPLLALGKPGLHHPTLLCKTWPSRDRLSLPNLAQALPLDQSVPSATQNSNPEAKFSG